MYRRIKNQHLFLYVGYLNLYFQLDIELSFTNQEGVMALAEDLISQCWRATVQPDLSFDRFPVMKFNDVYNAYGTDKPDIRFDMKVCKMW